MREREVHPTQPVQFRFQMGFNLNESRGLVDVKNALFYVNFGIEASICARRLIGAPILDRMKYMWLFVFDQAVRKVYRQCVH